MIGQEVHKEIQQQLIRFARKHGVPCMSGATEDWLVQQLMTWKPRWCAEIGSAVGWSTLRIAQTIALWDGQIISREISHPSYMIAMYHIRKTHTMNATIYHQNILESTIEVVSPHPFDFVFIDGAKQEYADYLEQILSHCAPGAHIVCDDVGMYADKVAPLFTVLDTHNLSYTFVDVEENDRLLVITT